MAIQRRPFSRLLRHARDTEDVFSTLTPGVLTGVHFWGLQVYSIVLLKAILQVLIYKALYDKSYLGLKQL